jgi:hypothetical protein
MSVTLTTLIALGAEKTGTVHVDATVRSTYKPPLRVLGSVI